MLAFVSCNDELEELFANPNSYSPTTDVIESMSAKVLQLGRDPNNMDIHFYWQMRADGYGWPVRTHITTNGHHYSDFDVYDDFMASVPQKGTGKTYTFAKDVFRAMPTILNDISNLPEDEQAGMMAYYHMLRILYLHNVTVGVDYYNSIPYSEALLGGEGVFYPKFDDPWEIYQDVLAKYKEEADALAAAYSSMNAEQKAKFENYDLWFDGDVSKWESLAAAYRLRAAIRVSGVKEAEAKAVISEILSSGKLPTTNLESPVEDWMYTFDGQQWKGPFGKFHYWNWVGPEILYWMDINEDHVYDAGSDDPRLPIFAIPNREGLYQSPSYDQSVAQSINAAVGQWNKDEYNFKNGYTYNKNDRYRDIDLHLKYDAYSHWHPFSTNRTKESQIFFSVAEVEMLLCEAEMKGLATTGQTATQRMTNAVKESLDQHYRFWDDYGRGQGDPDGAAGKLLNNVEIPDMANPGTTKIVNFKDLCLPETPAGSELQAYADVVGGKFDAAAGIEDKMEILMQQKFLHLNVHNVIELFSEFRRTRHPVLGSFLHQGELRETRMLERQIYPADPGVYNAENFAAVISENNYTTPIFWVPESKKSIQPFEVNEKYFYVKYPGVPETFNE